MEKVLKVWQQTDGGDIPFPSAERQITICDFEYDAVRMGGAPSITATVYHEECLDGKWNGSVYVSFNGERYFVQNTPSSSKDNTDARYVHDVEFLSERNKLANALFVDAVQGDPSFDRYKTNSTNIIFMGDIAEFVSRINAALSYIGCGYTAVLDEGIGSEDKMVQFSDRYILDALQEIYNIYGLPYYFVGKVIHVGYTENAIPTVMRYGNRDALLSISKENANYRLVNNITGTGSGDNIPYYYPNTSPDGVSTVEISPGASGLKEGDIIVTDGAAFAKASPDEYFTYAECVTSVPSKNAARGEKCIVSKSRFYTGYDWSAHTGDLVSEADGSIMTRLRFSLSLTPAEDPRRHYVRLAGNRLEIELRVDSPCRIKWVTDLPNEITADGISLTPTTGAHRGYVLQDGTDHALDSDSVYISQSELGYVTFYCSIEYVSGYPTSDAVGSYCYADIRQEMSYEAMGWSLDGVNSVRLPDYGLEQSVSASPSEGDSFHRGVGHLIPFSQQLMPAVYRETAGADMFYPAKNGTYKDSEGAFYEFENEFSTDNRRDGKTEFPDIKPSIEGMTNAVGSRMDIFAGFAYDLNDNDEIDPETNEYRHPYFFALLRKTDGDYGFNLFDQAIEQQAMQISMTSGVCGGCTFTVMVGENSNRNTVQVDENGNLLRDEDGNVRCGRKGQREEIPQDRQNDTRNYMCWIALEKDTSTYSHSMPNNYFKPAALQDTFVILGINMPFSYILAAEKRLEDALIRYMWENNKEKFNFSINFSRIFFAEKPDVLSLLNENARLLVEYDGLQHTLYVSEFTYRMASDSPLPEVSVTLVDTLSVGSTSMQNIMDGIEADIFAQSGSADFLRQALKYFIRKDIRDSAKELITFYGGAAFGSEGYASGISGFGAKIDEDGNGEMGNLTVRRSLTVPELRFNRTEISVGNKWRAPGAGIIEKVEIDTRIDELNGEEVVTELASGIITLHLEDGEIGAVAVDDICMGIFHDWSDASNNASSDSDDGRGNFEFAGFATVYFRITEMLDSERNSRFRYVLRGTGEHWSKQTHPFESMHFVAYGNFTDTPRQTSVYETRTYTRMLVKQQTWEISASNIAMQWGDLTNLDMFGLSMSGYSAYLNNIYMSGTIEQGVSVPYRMELELDGDQFLSMGETLDVTAKVFRGWDDVTGNISEWTVTRESTDVEADTQWAQSDKAQAFKSTGSITLSYSDEENDMGMGFESQGTLFNFEAVLPDGGSVSTQLLLRAYSSPGAVVMYWLIIDRNVVNASDGTVQVNIQTMRQEGDSPAAATEDGMLKVKSYSGGSSQEEDLDNAGGKAVLSYDASTTDRSEISYFVDGELVDMVGVVTVKDGGNGEPGKTTYFHIKYSSSPDGNPMSETPDMYIGTYVDFTEKDSDNYLDYQWSRFQGLQGEQGIPGANGIDGNTYYLHIKYSDDGGVTFTENNGETPGAYIGVMTDMEQTDSTDPSDYTWSKIKGSQGEPGESYWLVVEPKSMNLDEIPDDGMPITVSMMEQTGGQAARLSTGGVFFVLDFVSNGVQTPSTVIRAADKNPFTFDVSAKTLRNISKWTVAMYLGEPGEAPDYAADAPLLDYFDLTITSNGQDGVSYDLVPSVAQIKHPLRGDADDRIALEAYRIEGGTRSGDLFDLGGGWSDPEGYKAQYSVDGGDWTDCGVTYNGSTYVYGVGYTTVQSVAESLGLRLCLTDGTVLKTIPSLKVVSDAERKFLVVNPAALKYNGSTQTVRVERYRQYGNQSPAPCTEGGVRWRRTFFSGVVSPWYWLANEESSWELSMLESFAEATIEYREEYNNAESVLLDTKTVVVVKDGEQGASGLQGCILRTSEWASGVQYRNDEALTSGTRFLDIAVVTQSATAFTAYKCKQTHTSSSTNKPGSGSSWNTYWERFNMMVPVYTPLIMAQNALLRFTQTNQLLVMKADGTTVAAGMGGGDFPIWAGAQNPEDAPFRVSIAGKLYAIDAEITGIIKSTGGRFIGGIGNPYVRVDLNGTVQFLQMDDLVAGQNTYVVNSKPSESGAGIYLPIQIGAEDKWDGVEFNIRNMTTDYTFAISHSGNLQPRITCLGRRVAYMRMPPGTLVRFKVWKDPQYSDGIGYEIQNPSDFYIMPSGTLENGEVFDAVVAKRDGYVSGQQRLVVNFYNTSYGTANLRNTAQGQFYPEGDETSISWGPFYLSKSVWYNVTSVYNTNIPCHNYWFGLESGKARNLTGFDVKHVMVSVPDVGLGDVPMLVLQMYNGQTVYVTAISTALADTAVVAEVKTGSTTGSQTQKLTNKKTYVFYKGFDNYYPSCLNP